MESTCQTMLSPALIPWSIASRAGKPVLSACDSAIMPHSASMTPEDNFRSPCPFFWDRLEACPELRRNPNNLTTCSFAEVVGVEVVFLQQAVQGAAGQPGFTRRP